MSVRSSTCSSGFQEIIVDAKKNKVIGIINHTYFKVAEEYGKVFDIQLIYMAMKELKLSNANRDITAHKKSVLNYTEKTGNLERYEKLKAIVLGE